MLQQSPCLRSNRDQTTEKPGRIAHNRGKIPQLLLQNKKNRLQDEPFSELVRGLLRQTGVLLVIAQASQVKTKKNEK